MTRGSGVEDGSGAPGEPRRRRRHSKLVSVLVVFAVVLLAGVGLFVWGYFQPKPAGFAPVDPDEPGVVTEAWTRYTIDARGRDEWVFFDFGQGRTVDTTFSGDDWDLAFKRTGLLTSSGVTNPDGSGGAINLGEIPLEDAAVPPSATFVVDKLGGEDEDEPTNPAISDWYTYSFLTHTVHAKDNTYLVRGGDNSDALVHFDSYYCEDEEPTCITFRYRLVQTDRTL